jgi:integrase
MKEQNRSTTTQSMYLRALRCIINKAIDSGDFRKESYPFGRYRFEIPESRNVKKALKEAEISSIVNYRCEGPKKKARDFWYLIYLCGGINVQDVCLLKYPDIKRNKIEYERSKTARTKKKKSKITILITDDIKYIIQQYGQGGDSYIFPILKTGDSPERRKQLIQHFTHWINDNVKEIAEDLEIDIPVTTYVARHSYASQLLRSGISISAISKKMHDGNIKTTMNYLSDLTDEQEIEMANALISFKNKIPQAKVVNL